MSYVELLHDREYMTDCNTGQLVPSRMADACWKFGTKSYFPAPEKLGGKPDGMQAAFRITKPWLDYTLAINPDPETQRRLLKINAFWMNTGANKDYYQMAEMDWLGADGYPTNGRPFPRIERISGILNRHRYIQTKNRWHQIEAFNVNDAPPDPKVVNPQTHPWLFCQMLSIDVHGNTGYAPVGRKSFIPILTPDEAWVEAMENGRPKTRFVDQPNDYGGVPPEEPMSKDYQWGGDIHPTYQPIFTDDGIDEGWEFAFVFQKFAQGTENYTSPSSFRYEKWLAQYESLPATWVRGGYHWFETELTGEAQAKVAVAVANAGTYEAIACDYESWNNVIDLNSALQFKAYMEYFWANSSVKVLLYTNAWIRAKLREYLGAWMDKVDIWLAGGPYYGVNLSEPVPDLDLAGVFADMGEPLFLQISARSQVADEVDFGTSETAAIDLDVFNGTHEELLAWAGKGAPPPPPPSDCAAELNAERQNIMDYIQGRMT